MDMSDVLKALFEKFQEERLVVKKTIPAKPEWQKKHEEITALEAEHEQICGKINALKKSFWSNIALELNDFSSMQYNTKTKEIEIMEQKSDKSEKGIKSPFVRHQ